MATTTSRIVYTLTDEAPRLATCSLLPIIRAFAAPAGIELVGAGQARAMKLENLLIGGDPPHEVSAVIKDHTDLSEIVGWQIEHFFAH